MWKGIHTACNQNLFLGPSCFCETSDDLPGTSSSEGMTERDTVVIILAIGRREVKGKHTLHP